MKLLPKNGCIPLKGILNSLKCSNCSENKWKSFLSFWLHEPSLSLWSFISPVHDSSLLICWIQVSQHHLASLWISSISGIHSHLVGNPGKWNASCGATARNCPMFNVIIVALMQFSLVNYIRVSFWLTVLHEANKLQFVSSNNQPHSNEHNIAWLNNRLSS